MSRSDSRSSTYVEMKRSTGAAGSVAAAGSPEGRCSTANRAPNGRARSRARSHMSGLWSTARHDERPGYCGRTSPASFACPQPNSNTVDASANNAMLINALTAGPPYPLPASLPPIWPVRAKPS